MASTASAIAPQEQVSFRRLVWVGPLTIVVATIANAIVRLLAVSLFTISPDFMQLQPGPPVIFSIIGVLGAVIVFALLARFSHRPIRLFRNIALIVLLITFLPDIGLLLSGAPGATPLSVGVLMLMHVIAWAISVGMLTRLAREA